MPISGESSEFFTAGVTGTNSTGGSAVEGRTKTADTQASFGVAGVIGINEGAGAGVAGTNTGTGVGVLGSGRDGVQGRAGAPGDGAGVRGVGYFGSPGVVGEGSPTGSPGILGRGQVAGRFEGDLFAEKDVVVQGTIDAADITVRGDLLLQGADYAEALTVADRAVTAGMVVVLDECGEVRPCVQEYDTRVAGVVSGAGGVPPALVLDRHEGGAPVALAGKLWVYADATTGPIRPGDLLTTSSTPGHAKRVSDYQRALGAVIGKALTSLDMGTGLVRVLVAAC